MFKSKRKPKVLFSKVRKVFCLMQTLLYCLMFHGIQLKRQNPRELDTWHTGALSSLHHCYDGKGARPTCRSKSWVCTENQAKMQIHVSSLTIATARARSPSNPQEQSERQMEVTEVWGGVTGDGGGRQKECGRPTPSPIWKTLATIN